MNERTNPTGPLSNLMAALAVFSRDFDQVLDHSAEANDWDSLVVDLARLEQIGKAARDLALRAANQRGKVSTDTLGTFVGRSKARVSQLLRNASQPSGTWAVLDAAGVDIGRIQARPFDRLEASRTAEQVYGTRAADVRALSGFEVAESELAAEAELAPPRTTG